MSKVGSMTIGLVLIFVGAQLYLVKSYLLTPTATRFVSDYFNSNNGSQFSNPNAGQGLLTSSNGQMLNGGRTNGGVFSNSGFRGNSIGGNNNFGTASMNNGQIARYPGQSWPYHTSGTSSNRTGFSGNGGAFGGNGLGNGGLVQNSSFSSTNQAFASGGQANFDGQLRRRVMPPKWIMWPALFLGGVCFLHGLALRG